MVSLFKWNEYGDGIRRYIFYPLLLLLCLFSVNASSQNLKRANIISQQLSVETDHYRKAELLLELSKVQGIAQIESSLEHAERALTIFQNIQNNEGQIRAYLTLGQLELGIGNDPLARSYFNKAYALGEEIGDMETRVRSKLQLGKTYKGASDSHIGLQHLEEALSTAQTIHNNELISEANSTLGAWYNHLGQNNTAIGYFVQALEAAKLTKNDDVIADCYHSLGNGYLRSSQWDQAYDAFEKALRINESLGRKEKQAALCYELGMIRQRRGQSDEALILFKNSLALAVEVGQKEYITKAYQILSDVYEENHDYEKAYQYLKLVHATQGVSEIDELETQLESQRILRENQVLKQKQEQEAERRERERETNILILVIFIILCGGLAYMFFVNQQKQRVNNDLEQAKQKAEESEKEKEKFLTYTSHEIRTPLNAVVGVAQLLEQTQLTLKQQEYLKTIQHSAQNILHIVNDVLDLSKIESGAIELESIQLPIKSIVNNIINTLIFKLHKKDVKLVNDYDEEIPTNLKGDPVRLNQILLNLADNAVKFTREGEIRIAAHLVAETDREATIAFSVSDTGKGIRQSSLKQIFNRYEQETIHTTRNYGGTGLGLPITKQLIELMGGEIQVESTYGTGTTFRFEITFKKLAAKEKQEDREEIQDLSILYVDDNQLNRELFYDLVTDKGNSVHVDLAEDARQAILKLERKTFDAILLDIQMPRMDGYQLADHIRTKMNLTEVPIIALTAYAPDDIEERCEEVGMNGYLTKPIDLNELNRLLNLNVTAKEDGEQNQVNLEGIKTNLKDLHKLVNHDKAKLVKYVSISIETVPKDVEAMQTHLDHEDWELLAKAAHKMKSNAGYMGMHLVMPLLLELEKLKQGEGQYDKIAPIVEEVEKESLLALEELKNVLNNLKQ